MTTEEERGKCFRCRELADFYIQAVDEVRLSVLVCPKCVYRYGKESYEEYRNCIRQLNMMVVISQCYSKLRLPRKSSN